MSRAVLHCGDVRDVLAGLPERSVQCCVTSPPYYSLRDYGHPGQLGLEATPDEYVANMVEVFRAVWRVLRDDGCVFINLGDSYCSVSGSQSQGSNGQMADRTVVKARAQVRDGKAASGMGAPKRPPSIAAVKPKDLIGVPWLVAFALRADGWYLRSDIIWAKPNPMPESVTDRPTKSHEYLFLLTKSPTYYYDAAAIAEPVTDEEYRTVGKIRPTADGGPGFEIRGGLHNQAGGRATRNARSVWTIATQPYPQAHFATFPEELARRCILAGSSAKACESCGAPWERVTERIGGPPRGDHRKRDDFHRTAYDKGARPNEGTVSGASLSAVYAKYGYPENRTTGWQPTCSCEANTGAASSVVLDPFGGSGTTAAVAVGHGRSAIYVDLNPAYLDLARQRIGPMFCDDTPTVEVA